MKRFIWGGETYAETVARVIMDLREKRAASPAHEYGFWTKHIIMREAAIIERANQRIAALLEKQT